MIIVKDEMEERMKEMKEALKHFNFKTGQVEDIMKQ